MNRHVYTNGHAGGGAYPMSPTFVESRGRTFSIRPDKYEKYVQSPTLCGTKHGQHQGAWVIEPKGDGLLIMTGNIDINHDPQGMLFTGEKVFFFDSAELCPSSPSFSCSSSLPFALPP